MNSFIGGNNTWAFSDWLELSNHIKVGVNVVEEPFKDFTMNYAAESRWHMVGFVLIVTHRKIFSRLLKVSKNSFYF